MFREYCLRGVQPTHSAQWAVFKYVYATRILTQNSIKQVR